MAQVQPAVAPIQTRFDGGVISPRLAGRFDSELYKKSLKECSNFEPLPQGSLRMRSGSEKIQALTGGANTKLIQIRMSTGQDFLVELIEKVAHLYSLDTGISALQTVSTSELIANGSFSLPNGANWSMKLHAGGVWADAVYDTGYFADNTGAQLNHAVLHRKSGESPILYQRIVVAGAASIHVVADVRLEQAACKVKISTTVPTAWADETGGGEVWTAEIGSPASADLDLITRDFGNVPVAAGIYYVSFQVTQSIFSAIVVDNVSFFTSYGTTIQDIPTPWSAVEASAVQHRTETGRDRTIFVHPNHSPWALLYGGQPGSWTFGNIAFTSTPLAWGDAGSNNVPPNWSWQGQTTVLAQANWPATVEIHDGRVYYSGEPAQKNRIVASRSGSSDDFTVGANPGDMLDYKLSTKGAIKWLREHRTLLAGTDLGKHSITGSKGTPLVGDIQAKLESEDPCAAIAAVVSGTQVIYVSSELRRIRASTFDFRTQGFEAKDLTFAAEHITAPLLKEIHHARTPDNLILALLQDGTLIACSFEPEEGVSAWWTVNVGGTVYSAAVQQGALGSYLWMAVGRGGATYLEKLHLSESTEPLRYLDASIATVADVNGKVSGLDHLNGLNARIALQGGGWIGDFAVAGGAAQLGADNANAAVFAGLPYLARAVTLPRDLRHGKAQSPKVGVILNDSALPKLNGNRPPDRSPGTPMNQVQPRTTGKRIAGSLGWSDEDSITIEQDLPLRTEICAVYSATQTEQNL